ncbi:MAG: YbjQ family protein [Candidatus Hydrogenedentes bacterium]|nr:YbjQ family protein [Candidatus Hydrogenedentota bacterium]
MIVVTTEHIHGKRIVKTLGMVRGGTVRGMHLGHDIIAGMRNLVGGEIEEYTKMLAEAREQALDRMIHEARRLGANAILAARFTTSDIAKGAAEILIYGTAVVLDDDAEIIVDRVLEGALPLTAVSEVPPAAIVEEELSSH